MSTLVSSHHELQCGAVITRLNISNTLTQTPYCCRWRRGMHGCASVLTLIRVLPQSLRYCIMLYCIAIYITAPLWGGICYSMVASLTKGQQCRSSIFVVSLISFSINRFIGNLRPLYAKHDVSVINLFTLQPRTSHQKESWVNTLNLFLGFPPNTMQECK